MMKDDDFKLLRGFDYGQTDEQTFVIVESLSRLKNKLQRLANYLIIISPIDLSFGMKGCFRRLIEPPKFQKS